MHLKSENKDEQPIREGTGVKRRSEAGWGRGELRGTHKFGRGIHFRIGEDGLYFY